MAWRWSWSCTSCVAFAFVAASATPARAQTLACDAQTVAAKQGEFTRLLALKRFNPQAVSDASLQAASLDYVQTAESCYASLSFSTPVIDDGPLMPGTNAAVSDFQTSGAKWGAGTLYGAGVDVSAPGLPGGTVTYSFMASGVTMAAHSDANLAVSSLPGYAPCFTAAIRNAFAAWSAVANIQFVEVTDNGVPFDGAGARGDIRIGAHSMDGQWGVLAHAFFPPPGGVSAAGDMHFDRNEPWACAPGPGAVDIGIVAMHEIGHAIGLNHETRLDRTALMNPYYNPNTASILLADDVVGATAIYGRGVPATDELLVNFGPSVGLWQLDYGLGWRQVHGFSPRQTVSADLDRNGISERVVNFGDPYGVWVNWNNAGWTWLHGLSPSSMVGGDFNANGYSDVAFDFVGWGVWILYDGWHWQQVLVDDPTVMSVGNIDGVGGQDLLMTRPGHGVWALMNSSTLVKIHPNDADLITVGALDAPSGPADVLVQIPNVGVYRLTNYSTWSIVTASRASQLLIGQLDGDLRGEVIADFGPSMGLWINWNGTQWTPLHGLTSEHLTVGDLDGNGRDDVAVRFRSLAGLWMFVNGSSWVHAHGYSPTDLTISEIR